MFKKILVRRLGASVALAFLFAATFFVGLQNFSAYKIEKQYKDSVFLKRQKVDDVEALQNFIKDNQVGLENFYKITQWVNREKITTVSLYYEDSLIYDSTISYRAGTLKGGIKRKPLPWVKLYPLHFKDGEALVHLDVYHKHHDYDMAMRGNMIIFFIFFFVLTLFIFHRKTTYILELEQKVLLMQGGCLDVEIPIRGQDEISSLAENIEGMRSWFIERQKDQEKSQKFVAQMSHDIRTPLSGLIGYLDIVKNKRVNSHEKWNAYIGKSMEKANQIKCLTDQLFSYYTDSTDSDFPVEKMEETIQKSNFENFLDEGVFLMESAGFSVKITKNLPSTYEINMPEILMQRIVDNIFSNVINYAEKSERVWIDIYTKNKNIIMQVNNKIRNHIIKGTGIGLAMTEEALEVYGGNMEKGIEGDRYFLKISVILKTKKNH